MITQAPRGTKDVLPAESYRWQYIEERMRKADLLVIDDLGKEKPSPFTNELFYRVVNGRYKDKLPMIITSNYGVESLSERLDYAVFSRLVAMCRAVEMRGIDYRMKDYLC